MRIRGRVLLRGLQMPVFRKILFTYLMDDPLHNSSLINVFSNEMPASITAGWGLLMIFRQYSFPNILKLSITSFLN